MVKDSDKDLAVPIVKGGANTPGPWYADKANSLEALGVFKQHGNAGIRQRIATIEPVEGEANARLISLAPELLECLRLMREEFAKLPHSLGYEFTHLPKIDAVLAKL